LRSLHDSDREAPLLIRRHGTDQASPLLK
jgi:hypothetical protein